MQNNLFTTLKDTLKKDERFISNDGYLLKNIIRDNAINLDEKLIGLLLDNDTLRKKFFIKIKDALIFDSKNFINFLNNKEFLENSFTRFKNKVGLSDKQGDFLASSNEIVLSWPYKDCILAGGQTKEDAKKVDCYEIFYNEILGSDDIDRLLDEKVFTNFKRISKAGEEKLDTFKRDAEINKKRNLPEDTITDNLLIKGNNLLALHSLKKEFAGKVKLIYIDPPYNTGNDSFKYNDRFNHSTWLTFMKNRLEVAKELLSNDGSIYINIDFNEGAYLKVLMDEVFGIENFQREIIWRIGWLSGYKTIAKNYIRNHDSILFYSKNPNNFIFNKIYNKFEDYQDRFNQEQKKNILNKLKELNIKKNEGNNFLNFISQLGFPEKYPLEDTWNSSIYDKLNSIAVVSFSGEKVSKMLGEEEIKGQKSELLLKRIIQVSTNPGDIVLDYHLGSGTTSAVAHKMGRQYIGVEQMDYIETISKERIKKVIEGEQGGISKNVEWKGGGDFVYMEIMEENEKFIKEIECAGNDKELLSIYDKIKNSEFINYFVDIKSIDENLKSENNKDGISFEDLSMENKKRFLIELLDKNLLYKNFSEIDDENSGVSEEDKKLNKEFY